MRAIDLQIRWLSGKTSTTGPVDAGQLVTVFEDVSESPAADGYLIEPYRALPAPRNQRPDKRVIVKLKGFAEEPSQFRLITTMATWCNSCKSTSSPAGSPKACVSERSARHDRRAG